MMHRVREFLISSRKFGDDIVDLFRPKNQVEIIIRHAATGDVHKVLKGRNIVTGFLASSGARSGRDVMRRLLINSSETALSAQGTWVAKMAVGTGGNAEQSSDTALNISISHSDATQNVGTPTLDSADTYVTFAATWGASALNGTTIKEVALLSNQSTPDFLARKTFQAFTKTADFTFEVRWTLRF